MRGLIRTLLADVARKGLPGAHHFFITFDTRHKDVIMSDQLHRQYPKDIPIIIKDWFENLSVHEKGFEITLNFNNIPEPIYIPFAAIRTFVDPSVEFGLHLEETDSENSKDKSPDLSVVKNHSQEKKPSETQKHADVISLDNFR